VSLERLYHYLPDAHGLEQVKKGGSARTIARYVPDQPWYEHAAALGHSSMAPASDAAPPASTGRRGPWKRGRRWTFRAE
jgi:hypothetical protein